MECAGLTTLCLRAARRASSSAHPNAQIPAPQYTSGGSVEDLDQISAEDIVTVHVNDAPEGLALEEQVDNDRRLPMETGVIDLPGFMGKLSAMGYDGPVTPEPFSKRINAIDDPVEAARLAAVYMDKLWKAGGLG